MWFVSLGRACRPRSATRTPRARQVAVIFWVEDREFRSHASGRLDRLHRIPEREHHELGLAADVAAQHPHTAIAFGACVPSNPGLLHVPRVRVAIGLRDGATPEASDHRPFPFLVPRPFLQGAHGCLPAQPTIDKADAQLQVNRSLVDRMLGVYPP
jgi:hypothetical protein